MSRAKHVKNIHSIMNEWAAYFRTCAALGVGSGAHVRAGLLVDRECVDRLLEQVDWSTVPLDQVWLVLEAIIEVVPNETICKMNKIADSEREIMHGAAAERDVEVAHKRGAA